MQFKSVSYYTILKHFFYDKMTFKLRNLKKKLQTKHEF